MQYQNPFLRGWDGVDQRRANDSVQNLNMVGGLLGLQNQMQQQAMQQRAFLDKQQQQQHLEQFASQLPPEEQAKFRVAPLEYIKEANRKYVIDGALVPGSGGKPIYQAPPKPQLVEVGVDGQPGVKQKQWVIPGQAQGQSVGGALMPEILNKDVQNAKLRIAREGRASVTTNVLPPQKTFENEDKLRADYTSNPLVKSASEMQNAFNLIQAAYERPSAANDLAMATKYMKILDPTSVVRESEFALAVNATGLLDKVQNYSAAILEGKKLNPNQRKDFYESAKAINDAFQKQRGEVDNQYSEMATGYGLNPKNVIPSLRKTDQQPDRRNQPRRVVDY